MRLAIGDVVRDRTDSAIGTVAGLAAHPDGPLVAFQVSDDLRLAEPGDLDVIARVASPAAGTNAVRAAGYLVAVLDAYVAAHSAHALGADWALTALSGAGGYSAITCAVRWLLSLANPRRFRV
jgi:hypothetical protein